MPRKKSPVTPSTPPNRRASSRANAIDGAVPESISSRDENRETATPVAEIASSVPPLVDRVLKRNAVRARSAPIIGGEQPDVFVVDFLINFLADHRSDTGAERIPCGEVTGVDGITEEIQARFVPKLGPGYYRITPRVNGKITTGKWVEYVSAPGYVESDLYPDEIEDDFIEESSSDDSREVIRLRERLRYEQKLREAHSHNGNGHSPIVDKLLERVLAEKLNDDPVEKVIATFEAVEKIKESVRPHRESTPTSIPTPSVDPKVTALKIVAENPTLTGIAEKVFGLNRESDSNPWADVAMELVKSGQAASLFQAGASILGNIFSAILPKPAQSPDPSPVSHQPQSPQQAQAAPQVMPANAQALPQADQQPQPQPAPEIANADPYTAMLTDVITALMKNDPVDGAIKRVDGFLLLAPQYTEVINSQFGQNAETLLGAIGTIPGCEQIPQFPHAKQWVEQFQAKFFDEEVGETSPAEAGA
jgi:hypothetical protein